MGRKATLKQLIDIVLMLKQFTNEEGATATVKKRGTYYGNGGISAPTGSETPIRPSPLFPKAGTSDYAPVVSHDAHRDATKQRIKSNKRLERHAQIPKGEVCTDCGGEMLKAESDAGQGSRAYTGTLSDEDREELKQGRVYSRKTGKRLIREGSKFHPVTGEPVQFPQTPGQASQGTSSEGELSDKQQLNLDRFRGLGGPAEEVKEIEQLLRVEAMGKKKQKPSSSAPIAQPTPSPTPSAQPTPSPTPSAIPKAPTPSAPSSAPSVAPTPTTTPKPEPTAPPKETFNKAFPGFPQF